MGNKVVGTGMSALRDCGVATDLWLKDEVAPVYDAMKANPKRAIPAAKVFAALRAHHAASIKQHRPA